MSVISEIDTLTRLAREFVVRDIMIPEADLVRSTDLPGARELLAQFPDFDMIPVQSTRALEGFVERESSTLMPIRVDDLVSEATSILDVVDILKCRPRVFVLVRDRIGGYVHFSDLNRPIVKLPFFVLLEAVERHFFDSLATTITEETLKSILDPKRLADVSEKMSRLRAKKSDLNWAALLGFKDLLLCARQLGLLCSEVSEIDSLSKVRNLVCHAASTDLLVEEYSHVRRLADAKRFCFTLLQGY